MGAVLGQNGNARTGLEIAALQMCRHAPRLIQHLAPGVFDQSATTDRLDEEHLVRSRGLVVVNVVQNQFGIAHAVSSTGPRRLHDEALKIPTPRRRPRLYSAGATLGHICDSDYRAHMTIE